MTQRRRRGMVLPLVMIGMLLASTMAAALQLAAWRAQRGAQGQWDAQRASYAAEAEVTRTIAAWQLDSLAALPTGQRRSSQHVSDGWQLTTTVTRSAPSTLVVSAVARREHHAPLLAGTVQDGARVRRRVVRTVRLMAPSLPVLAAATMLGSATVDAATFDGRDIALPYQAALSDCGPTRDTASRPALAAAAVSITAAPVVFGALEPIAGLSLTHRQQQFDSAFAAVASRAGVLTQVVAGPLPPTPPWAARVMVAPGTVILDGTSTHVGVLAIDGNLDVRGTLHVDGLLLVRGALTVSSGTLSVSGALVVRDVHAIGSTLSANTQVRYDACRWRRALIPVSTVRTAGFGVWNGP